MAVHLISSGLIMPASQSASGDANALDDYEEGSWTSIIGGQGGQSGQSYASQQGQYMKIGAWVCLQAYIGLTDKGTITGNYPVVAGHPFTSAASVDEGLDGLACSTARVEQIKVSSGWIGPMLQGGAGGTTSLMMEHIADGTGTASHRSTGNSYGAGTNAIQDASAINFGFWYKIGT